MIVFISILVTINYDRIVLITITPTGISPPGWKNMLGSGDRIYSFPAFITLSIRSTKEFFVLPRKMEDVHQGKSDSECFELFTNDPKGVSIEIVKGASAQIHRKGHPRW